MSAGLPSTLLFVYGSLRRGAENHHELRGAELVAEVRTAPAYRLLDAGSYPALAANGVRSIRGELYRVSAELLESLDEFEGASYVRGELVLEDGSRAIAYFAHAELALHCAELALEAWPMR